MGVSPPWHLVDTLLRLGHGTVALQSVSVDVNFLTNVLRC